MQFLRYLSVAVLVSLFLVASAATAQSDDAKGKVPLYLPYTSSQHPELAVKLDAALEQAGLGNLKTTAADYWHPYQQGIRQGRLGVYLVPPHFAAWGIRKHRFKPLVRLPGSLQYVIATRRDDHQYFEISDLADKSVCSQQAVNLDFLLIRQVFSGSIQSARSRIVNSVDSAMRYDNQNCAAFAVSEHIFKQYNLAEPERFIRLQQGPEFNNYVYVYHPRIPNRGAARLKKFLQGQTASELLKPIYRQFSDKPSLVPAATSEYPSSYLQYLESYWD